MPAPRRLDGLQSSRGTGCHPNGRQREVLTVKRLLAFSRALAGRLYHASTVFATSMAIIAPTAPAMTFNWPMRSK
jgi:hypothetical protein